MSAASRLAAGLTGLFLGLALALLLTDGRWWPLASLLVDASALAAVVRALVPADERRRVGALVALGFAFHAAVAVGIFTGSLVLGLGGFVTGDDRAYATLAYGFEEYVRGRPIEGFGPPYWGGEAYLFGTWPYLESAIFFLVGREPLVPILLNSTLAMVTALLVYDMGARLFDRRAALVALVLTAFFPSLVLWSSLNLKDALALTLIGLCLWSLVRFHERPRWTILALAFAAILPLNGIRNYIFVGLTVLAPLVVLLTPQLSRLARSRWSALAVAASALTLIVTRPGIGLGPDLLALLEHERQSMAIGARTAFVAPPPIVVKEGDTFIVAAPGESAGASPATTAPPSPSVVYVAPDSRIVVVRPGEPSPTAGDAVLVRPGDIVVVGPPGTSPHPPSGTIGSQSETVALASASSVDDVGVRTIEHVPTGIAFALLGPAPWSLERQIDVLVLSDVFLWYVVMVAALVTVVRRRERWREYAGAALFVAGVLGLFSLVEGNWGTLIRHRDMVVPWTALLAAPALVYLIPIRVSGFRSSS